MAATTIGIVYAPASAIVRRWIVPDDDTDLAGKHPLAPGEAMLVVSRASIKSLGDVDAAVEKALGRPVQSPRCAVIDALGNVESVIMADPALDSVPGKTLMLHADAVPGWKTVADVLTPPVPDVSIDPVAVMKP